jgi:hypothetical protein
MLHGFLIALLDAALTFVAWWAPVVYFIAAGFITHSVAGDNERARNWMVGLFLGVFVLAAIALFGWPRNLDG